MARDFFPSPSGFPRVVHEELPQRNIDGILVRESGSNIRIQPYGSNPLRVAGGILSANNIPQGMEGVFIAHLMVGVVIRPRGIGHLRIPFARAGSQRGR